MDKMDQNSSIDTGRGLHKYNDISEPREAYCRPLKALNLFPYYINLCSKNENKRREKDMRGHATKLVIIELYKSINK